MRTTSAASSRERCVDLTRKSPLFGVGFFVCETRAMSLLETSLLEAFAAIAAEASFTRGAKRIGVTQSAMSQRIRKLEELLSVTLFVRKKDHVRVTSEGLKLLEYARVREGLEQEMLQGLVPEAKPSGPHVGVLRVAGFSTVTRSILVPSLTSLLQQSPSIVVHAFSRELRDLPALFRSGEADLVLTDQPMHERGVENRPLGDEQNVLVLGSRKPVHRILDHDPDDTISDRFARLNKLDWSTTPRSYLDDIYGVLDGVALGWGNAVVSAHLVESRSKLRIQADYKSLRTPVFLHVRTQRFRTRLEAATIESIEQGFAAKLQTPSKPRTSHSRR